MNEAAKETLRTRKSTIEAEPADLVFPPIFGKCFRDNLTHLFAALVDRIGLNKGLKKDDRQRRVVFHTLRHTFASWLAMDGVDIYRIKTLMRHKTLDMTMRYAHLIPDATQEAVNGLTSRIKNVL